jgi:hypothetical protein
MARGADGELLNPDYIGGAGRAWELPNRFEGQTTEQLSATLGGWLIEAPFALPAWNYHVASLVHLRDMPGSAPAVIRLPGATHELMMWALDPRFEDEIDPTDVNSMRHVLQPFDFEEQFKAQADERALEVVRFAIQKCVDGELVPDTDGRAGWRDFLNSHE